MKIHVLSQCVHACIVHVKCSLLVSMIVNALNYNIYRISGNIGDH